MTPAAFAAMVRYKLSMSSLTLTDANLLAVTNEVLPIVEQKINEKDNLGRQLLGVIGYADFTAGEREYPFPPDLLNKIIGVEAKIAATDDWKELEQFDQIYNHRTTDEDAIVNQFKFRPAYDLYRESLWIYSDTITNTASGNEGLKLWYLGELKRLDNLTEASIALETAPTGEADAQNFKRGIPKPIQYWLVRYITGEVKRDNEIALTDYETNIWDKLDEILNKLNPIDAKQTIEFNTPDLGSVGRYGFDL